MIRHRKRNEKDFWIGVLSLFLFVLVALPAQAELRIDITRGVVEPLPVAIPEFVGKKTQEQEIGQKIAFVILANLERSGLFRGVDPGAFIEKNVSLNIQPRFADWRVIGTQALINGGVKLELDGRLRVEFRLWDVVAEQQMQGLAYHTMPNNWRRVAHKISEAIYQRITGEQGYIDTRIIYIAESGPATHRIKRLAVMDQDGENHRFLTDGETLVLTPRFSKTAQKIVFLSYYQDIPRVYLFDIETGIQERLGDFPGMTFAPRFLPDDSAVVMSYAKEGNSDIYVMDLDTRQSKQLTSNPPIDTSPSFSPDGERVVFNSDRGGSPQLYTMNADGRNVRRISFGKGHYGTPVWSPRGDLIAFTKIYQNRFFIGVMKPDGSGERLLTESFRDEGPTWSPNGRVLMFFRQTPGNSDGIGDRIRLYSIDLTGYNEREVVTPLDASDPAWSPLIP
ncbi:MAG: Tol-Pal system protein TolB [Alphaproteobacteria bacterium]|nr:Tol-Pal system protein TolB [Alphaproteobacteria bacterium]